MKNLDFGMKWTAIRIEYFIEDIQDGLFKSWYEDGKTGMEY